MNEWHIIEKIRGTPKTYETITVIVNPDTGDIGVPFFVLILLFCIAVVIASGLIGRRRKQ